MAPQSVDSEPVVEGHIHYKRGTSSPFKFPQGPSNGRQQEEHQNETQTFGSMGNRYRRPATELRIPQRRTRARSGKTMQPSHIEGTVHGGSNWNTVPASVWGSSTIRI